MPGRKTRSKRNTNGEEGDDSGKDDDGGNKSPSETERTSDKQPPPKSPVQHNKAGAPMDRHGPPPPAPAKSASGRNTMVNNDEGQTSNGNSPSSSVTTGGEPSTAVASVSEETSPVPSLGGTQTSTETSRRQENGPLDFVSVSGVTATSSLGGTTTSASTNSAMARGIIDTPDDVRRFMMTKTLRNGDHAQVMVTKMADYIEELHAQILAMHSNMMSLAKIPKSGARQSGKSKATVELSKKEYVMKEMIDRGLDTHVWRQKAFFLKPGWHLYSATKSDSFCQMFMGWAKLRDLKPEMYGGEEVLWNRFVVPIVSQIMINKRANLNRKVHDWWGSKCTFLVVSFLFFVY